MEGIYNMGQKSSENDYTPLSKEELDNAKIEVVEKEKKDLFKLFEELSKDRDSVIKEVKTKKVYRSFYCS